jgi:capsular polysaccharide biosynthesis protein
MYRYGGKEIVEEYLQVLRSGRLGGKVTNRFNLMSHYGIDYADKDCYTKLWRMYNKNVTISRTEYNSIMVSVYDKNPKMASDIANSIVEFVDSVKYEMQLEMARKSLDIVSRKYEAKKIEVDTLKSLIRALGKKGIFNVGEQSQALTELVGKGFFKDANVKLLGENLAEYGGDRDALSGLLVWELSQLNDIKRKLDQCVADVDEHITYVFVIDKAYPSESKTYPIRSLIVLVSLLSSFLLACIILVFYERITDYRKDRMSI